MATGSDVYQRSLREAVRGLWSGVLDRSQFVGAMSAAIHRRIPQAWYEGAAECGIKPDELSGAERTELNRAIAYEMQWVSGLADAVEEGSREKGGKLAPFYNRLKIWVGRYRGVVDKAKTMACGDRKMMWRLGHRENHCRSCRRLNRKVKRASYWHDKGILPRVHGAAYLECNGFLCDCTLELTDEPLSKGPLPKLP